MSGRGPRGRGARDGARAGECRCPGDHRSIVRDYYCHPGHCPPGLAKKRNGCMPPGQAKKWHVGQRLPRDVTYYDLPRDLVIRLPPLSVDYKYVRVGADILQIAVGTGLVIRSEEHTSELQSLMRISYAVFCLKKKKKKNTNTLT